MAFSLIDKLLFATTLFIIWRWIKHTQTRRSRGLPLPPGPPRKPLIGNLFDIPKEKAWHKFLEWKHQYGDIVYADALGNGILVLNTLETINDLLDKRPHIYSDRPTMVMVGELMGVDRNIVMLPHGPMWKQHRRLTHISLSPEAVKKYYTLQEDVTIKFLDTLVEQPKDFIPQLRLTAGRSIMSVTYGLPVQTPDDLYITHAEETMQMIGNASLPGAFLVDFIPALKYIPSWVPFNRIHEIAAAGRKQFETMITRPFEQVKRNVASGTARPSFALDSLEAVKADNSKISNDEMEHLICWVAGAMYAAGGETTYAVILSFFLAMALYPEVQTKIKAEIDQVIGEGRLPSIQDRPDLPYVNATIKEIMRWRSTLPLGLARQTREDDFYKGYFIPKNTVVFPNIWAITIDEKSGIPSHHFAPERFLKSCVKETATEPSLYAFGFGRRVCPGRHLADNNMFLLVTGIMATMNVEKPKDAQGNPIVPDPGYTSGIVSHPEPFEIVITPRSSEAVAAIKERLSRAE